MKVVLFLVAFLLLPHIGGAQKGHSKKAVVVQQGKKASSRKSTGKKVPSLRGSKTKQQTQNLRANEEGLTRIKDDSMLNRFVASGLLVPLPESGVVKVDPRLDEDRRYARPWTKRFAENFGTAFHKQFKDTLQINSGVRTVESQKELRRTNGNAAAATGPNASSHLTGSTLDITYLHMTADQKRWAENYLREREAKGWITAVEEVKQKVFHIMVYQNYGKTTKLAKKK